MNMFNTCIFCKSPVLQNSVEHIVPESLGNKFYLLPNGSICRLCNNSFSEFEDKALSKTMLGFERVRLGVPTKKGKAAIAQNGDFKWTGNRSFLKNTVTIQGLSLDKISNFDSKTGSFQIVVPDFDKSEMATAKLLLKIGYESIFKSQRKSIYNLYTFSDLTDHLTKVNNLDWPFMTTTSLKLSDFFSIAKFKDKFDLNKMKCKLLISVINENLILFSFEYSILSYMINLSNRDTKWMRPYLDSSNLIHVYPEHLKNKI